MIFRLEAVEPALSVRLNELRPSMVDDVERNWCPNVETALRAYLDDPCERALCDLQLACAGREDEQQERAAILEYEANLGRHEAERRAGLR